MLKHFEKYLAIIFEDLVDKPIRDELHDFILPGKNERRGSFQCRVQNTHGPHSNLDVQQLTNSISELKPDTPRHHGMVQMSDGI